MVTVPYHTVRTVCDDDDEGGDNDDDSNGVGKPSLKPKKKKNRTTMKIWKLAIPTYDLLFTEFKLLLLKPQKIGMLFLHSLVKKTLRRSYFSVLNNVAPFLPIDI
jgi:hypothetical protein